MIGAKAPSIASHPLTIAMLVLTLTVSIMLQGGSPQTPSTAIVVIKKIAHRPPASESPAISCAGGLADVAPVISIPWSRAKWQSPPALLPDMVPFRGKKGDQAYDQYILSAADRYDMDPAVGGTRYLKKLMNRFDNDIELALAAYNAGSGNVRKHNGIPPFKATHRYIAKIKVYYQHYQDQNFDITG